jgi:hypothetical protein
MPSRLQARWSRDPSGSWTVRERISQAVADSLLGLGGLQRLLDDPLVENIDVNGCDQVFVRYADGRMTRAAPAAASDAELAELIRLIAARAGNEERRFDRASPSLDQHRGGQLFHGGRCGGIHQQAHHCLRLAGRGDRGDGGDRADDDVGVAGRGLAAGAGVLAGALPQVSTPSEVTSQFLRPRAAWLAQQQ